MLFFLNGCNDTPNSIGNGSLNKKVDYGTVLIDTFYATDHSSVQHLLATSAADRFMVGKYKTYQAWAWIKFYEWPDSLTNPNIKITGATILLKGLYHFGDSTASLSFDALRATASLASDSVTYDSLTLNSSFYFNNNPISIQSYMPVGDTMSMTINILDTTLLREWFSTNTDTMHLNDGLILRPTNSNIIKGFYTFSSGDTSIIPTLTISYIDTNGDAQSYSHKIGYSKYISTVNEASLITDNNLLYIQNGISYRGLVTFDSIAKISSNWPVSIFRAVLQVTSNSSVSVSHDSLYALSVGPTGQSDGISYALSQRDTIGSRQIYAFEARPIALRWLSNASIRKVALCGYAENSSFDLFKLYGTGAYRPRIIITYSLQR
jgi:hypothetical protein